MDWQQIVSLVLVTTAAVLVARRQLRQRKFSFERGTHCGCAAGPGSGPQSSSSIIFHARKGQRPEVRVRMR